MTWHNTSHACLEHTAKIPMQPFKLQRMIPAMKKSVLYCLLIMSGMYFASCNSDDGEDNAPITYADIEASFQTIPIEIGTQDLTLQITETLFYDFRVIFPNSNLDQDLPLVLALHWANNGDPTTHLETNCYVIIVGFVFYFAFSISIVRKIIIS